ncbi:palmitoyltransferase ZDHHC16B [Callorhinchus milii]|uniref:palmitoyltransferase ZDHHC16B n=1 Tax=Callorhinchus milii TaxID=7868 RepID=UPI001C3F67CD|nr:palmitoyltransferase ZDHHC16B [Callorhinchus milii]XP_042192972.1 palmitoyltransferase ZDHHC16B [Callorhinchus milii]
MRTPLRMLWRGMRVLLRCPRRPRSRRGDPLLGARALWAYARLCADSLLYNSFTNWDVVLDSLFEPIYWLVDHVTRWFGVVFVVMVIFLTSTIVLIVYVCVLPVIVRTYSAGWITWHLGYGHWNLLLIVFHYYKAVTSSPGYPPQEKTDVPMASICRKCIAPKPARTHHCSICNQCILKMDHHCPWLNNCVGHFNHRYFFSFCLSMTLGCVYCSVSSRQLFTEAFNAIDPDTQTSAPTISFRERAFHKCIIYLWVLCSSVALALSGLTLWHTVLICGGRTSIERHINKKEQQRQLKRGRVFRNPFNAGKLNNLKLFLGIEKRRHWLTRVLLPSSHPPHGDGLTWKLPQSLETERTVLAI